MGGRGARSARPARPARLLPPPLLLLLCGTARGWYLSHGGAADWTYGRNALMTYPCASNGTWYNCTRFVGRAPEGVDPGGDSSAAARSRYATTPRQTLGGALAEAIAVARQKRESSAAAHSPDSESLVADPGDDWTALNALLQQVTFTLPDFTQKVSVATISVSKLICGHLSLADLAIKPTRSADDTTVTLALHLDGLQIKCSANWAASVIGVHSSGALTADSTGSSLKSSLDFVGTNLNKYPPSSSKSGPCDANVVISDIHFTGGITAQILDLFKEISLAVTERTTCSISDGLGAFAVLCGNMPCAA